MDLGLDNKKALVCAASKGLGYGCALALVREGVAVTIVARGAAALAEAAERLGKEGKGRVTAIAADITTAAGREAALAACPDPDILVTNAGGPPPGNFRDWAREDWIRALDANMLTPIELIKANLDGMIARKFGRIINITSAAVKAPIDTLGLSNGARSGLTGFVAGLARQVAAHNVTINNLLPGAFATARLISNFENAAKAKGVTSDEMAAQRKAAIPAKRFGTAEEFGQLCAYVCSAQAGYLTGQNLLIDGGAFPGTF
jgi:3-oxoacyl-[acyl-carrier protein] reductase